MNRLAQRLRARRARREAERQARFLVAHRAAEAIADDAIDVGLPAAIEAFRADCARHRATVKASRARSHGREAMRA